MSSHHLLSVLPIDDPKIQIKLAELIFFCKLPIYITSISTITFTLND